MSPSEFYLRMMDSPWTYVITLVLFVAYMCITIHKEDEG